MTETTPVIDWKPVILNKIARDCFNGQKFDELGTEAKAAVENIFALSCKVENLPRVEAPDTIENLVSV